MTTSELIIHLQLLMANAYEDPHLMGTVINDVHQNSFIFIIEECIAKLSNKSNLSDP